MNSIANFYNGYDFFCTECNSFFNAGTESDDLISCCPICCCPICGRDEIIFDIDDFLEYLEEHKTDPVNFYNAFPPDAPIPNSCTGATPRQVAIILDLVANRHDIPLTIESIAGNCETSREVVRNVFKELHITEKP